MNRIPSPASGIFSTLAAFIFVLLHITGCVGPSMMVLPDIPPERNQKALEEAVETFYLAPDSLTMRKAVEAARENGPETALYHEIAAQMALLDGETAFAIEHMLATLLDPLSDATRFYIEYIWKRLNLTIHENDRFAEILNALRKQHPDPEVRALAAWYGLRIAKDRGWESYHMDALASLNILPFAVIGTWDNDQGKGFDMEYPPEREIDIDAQYRGYRVDALWRTDYPVHPYGYIDFSQLMNPNNWQVAYAATTVKTKKAGDFELRITTSSPVKVWVNDILFFKNRRISGDGVFDSLVLPVKLEDGANRILVKSAQERGSWRLMARITRPGGEAVTEGLSWLPITEEPAPPGPIPESFMSEEEIVALPFKSVQKNTVRRAVMESWWHSWMGFRAARLSAVEEFTGQHPDSIIGLDLLARATWNNQERDRAADLWGKLTNPWEEAFIEHLLMQARFWRQQNLDTQSRELLIWIRDHHPHVSRVWWKLANLMKNEKWNEEQCEILTEKLRLRPHSQRVLNNLADCMNSMRYRDQSRAIYEYILDLVPVHGNSLQQLARYSMDNNQKRQALAYARKRTEAWPNNPHAWLYYGTILRRAGEHVEAEKAWNRAIEISPLSSTGYMRIGRSAIEQGDREKAVEHFRMALERNPQSSKLVERIDMLATEKEEIWHEDIPSNEKIEAVLADRHNVEAMEGADLVSLLEDTVTHLSGDGIATTVVTRIARAENETGRDQLTLHRLRPGRHHRVLMAYAIDESDRRIEASSIRGREVRFRELSPGSTIILQYRVEENRQRFLDGHYSRRLFYNAGGDQLGMGRWIIWTPEDTVINRDLHPEIMEKKEIIDNYLRVEWTVNDLPPIIREQRAPHFSEIAVSVAFSTLPGWEVYGKWERALLTDAFRTTPELEKFTAELIDGAESPYEKLMRIYNFVIREIRYQQDYARPITGVKPHSAPVTFARKYGDCKDKAVLMITLSELAGIKAHYTLVKTRPQGPLLKNVPMQQFNHAIVYVPKQDGFEEGRFFDPTVDDLDLAVLRTDNQGVPAYIFNIEDNEFTWLDIPFQSPEVIFAILEVELDIGDSGEISGRLDATGQGNLGSTIRRVSRNRENLNRFGQSFLGTLIPGAQFETLDGPGETNLRVPASVSISFSGNELLRHDSDLARLSLPMRQFFMMSAFSLNERNYPLILGAYETFTLNTDVRIPEGWTFESIPRSATVETKCMVFERHVEQGEDNILSVNIDLIYRCERIETDEYSEHRQAAQQIQNHLLDEVVLRKE